mmetsp:Transcript_3221/g.10036  ORF Transcript_3221/g.10036 Transcript_3221/m.10036 type:complete len:289 (+) Transcript_3221:278-1144(+)
MLSAMARARASSSSRMRRASAALAAAAAASFTARSFSRLACSLRSRSRCFLVSLGWNCSASAASTVEPVARPPVSGTPLTTALGASSDSAAKAPLGTLALSDDFSASSSSSLAGFEVPFAMGGGSGTSLVASSWAASSAGAASCAAFSSSAAACSAACFAFFFFFLDFLDLAPSLAASSSASKLSSAACAAASRAASPNLASSLTANRRVKCSSSTRAPSARRVAASRYSSMAGSRHSCDCRTFCGSSECTIAGTACSGLSSAWPGVKQPDASSYSISAPSGPAPEVP